MSHTFAAVVYLHMIDLNLAVIEHPEGFDLLREPSGDREGVAERFEEVVSAL